MRLDTESVFKHLKFYLYPYTILLVLLMFSVPILTDLATDWYHDGNYSHGFFIIPISIFLFYRKRHDINLPAKTSRQGLALFVAGCILLIFGYAASEFFTTRFGLVIVLSGFAWYYLGNENFRKVWFAFFFLVFMIPVPAIIYHSATIPMQLFASKVTTSLLQLVGIPVMRNGNIINLPGYSLEVVEACSGLRSLVTLLALAALYAYFRLPGKVLPVVLFVAAIPIAIVTNVFRVFTAAFGAYAISKEVAEDFIHEISGLFVFFTALVIMVILGNILIWIRNRLRRS
ncbi:MAG: exosortase/archaeosortase family protein [Candidatus Zixiibacteriota bacterium]